ncbi:unnamed protein product, partial [Didymodactylos carnosus]
NQSSCNLSTCLIEYVENSYCEIRVSSNELEVDHNPNSALQELFSEHYIRATETIVHRNGDWQPASVIQISYGCDWNLCNDPRIISFLPTSLNFKIDSTFLTNLLTPDTEPLSTCYSCSKCIDSLDNLNCSTESCTGTCFIEDHIDDASVNTDDCKFAFETSCVSDVLDSSVEVTGTYYISDQSQSSVNTIDIYCRRTNCNNPRIAEQIRGNTSFTTTINDIMTFRPSNISVLPLNITNLQCYHCDCQQLVNETTCNILQCNAVEVVNGSYCEILRDFAEIPGTENIHLGHVGARDVKYSHYIRAVETIQIEPGMWHGSTVEKISYVCDWNLCNNPVIVNILPNSFSFSALPSEVDHLFFGTEPVQKCYVCSLCVNNSVSWEEDCESTNCTSGICHIDEHWNDLEYPCEYAFTSSCEKNVNTNVQITGTYDLNDGDKDVEINEMDLYCSITNCNLPTITEELKTHIRKNSQLDPSLFFRPEILLTTSISPPITATPVTATPITATPITAPITSSSVTTMPTSAMYAILLTVMITLK